MTTQPADGRQVIGPKNAPNGGVINGKSLAKFEEDGANAVAGVYNDPKFGGTPVVIWCLRPGQENSTQWHDTIAHVFFINEGEGIFMKGEPYKADTECPKATAPNPIPGFKPTMIPIKAGDIIFIPEKTIHGIRNTGKTNLSYVAVSVGSDYSRIDVGPQVPSHRRPGAPAH